jgi:hypothetical protein
VPLGLLLIAALQRWSGVGVPDWLGIRLLTGELLVHWAEPFMALLIVAAVAGAMTRDRQIEVDVHLALAPLDRFEIAFAKTFAPALGGVACLVALRAMNVAFEPDHIAALGLTHSLRQHPSGAIAFLPALAVHVVLVPCAIPMIAGQVAAHSRSPLATAPLAFALVIGWAILFALLPALGSLGLALAAGLLLAWFAVLSGSTAIAACLGIGTLWLTVQTIERESGRFDYVRFILCFTLLPVLLAIIIGTGLDGLGVWALAAMGTIASLLMFHELDPDGLHLPQAAVILQVLLTAWLAQRWHAWARRRFARLYFSPRLWSSADPLMHVSARGMRGE